MAAPKAHCEICFFNFPVDQFRVLGRCGTRFTIHYLPNQFPSQLQKFYSGHCFCETCTEKHKAIKGTGKAACPHCRKTICGEDKRLFLSFVDPAEAINKQKDHSIKLLGGLDVKTETETVERVGEYLEQVANNIEAESGAVEVSSSPMTPIHAFADVDTIPLRL